MKAYLHALQLRKECASSIIEPKSIELVAALAAGRRSKLVVEITSNGITPLTMALAVAAMHTGRKVVLCTTTLNNIPSSSSTTHESMELGDVVVEHVSSGDDDLGLKKYRGVDFVVVDGDVEHHLELLGLLDVNPIGSMIVGHNLDKTKGRGGYKGGCSSFGEALGRNKEGCYSVSLPIGDGGMELARLGGGGCCGNVPVEIERRYKRFHVTFEE
ncbi:unnamed protein product [Linum tenue]|uniref:Uncharacterized protein n=1 Tax=Linum tenue TaxID=586396 RepID=A0AAV0RF19_9ROSI|nr:unnamed protein product [Linum tenue]